MFKQIFRSKLCQPGTPFPPQNGSRPRAARKIPNIMKPNIDQAKTRPWRQRIYIGCCCCCCCWSFRKSKSRVCSVNSSKEQKNSLKYKIVCLPHKRFHWFLWPSKMEWAATNRARRIERFPQRLGVVDQRPGGGGGTPIFYHVMWRIDMDCSVYLCVQHVRARPFSSLFVLVVTA